MMTGNQLEVFREYSLSGLIHLKTVIRLLCHCRQRSYVESNRRPAGHSDVSHGALRGRVQLHLSPVCRTLISLGDTHIINAANRRIMQRHLEKSAFCKQEISGAELALEVHRAKHPSDQQTSNWILC